MAKAAAGMTHGYCAAKAAAVWKAKEIITALQAERAELLTACRSRKIHMSSSIPASAATTPASAPMGGPASAHAELRKQAYRSSVLATALSAQTFDSFDLSHYSTSPMKKMCRPANVLKNISDLQGIC
jgi:hypothetical protein